METNRPTLADWLKSMEEKHEKDTIDLMGKESYVQCLEAETHDEFLIKELSIKHAALQAYHDQEIKALTEQIEEQKIFIDSQEAIIKHRGEKIEQLQSSSNASVSDEDIKDILKQTACPFGYEVNAFYAGLEKGLKDMRSKLSSGAGQKHEDSVLLDFIEGLMVPGNDYVEVFFAGLRHPGKDAEKIQIECNPMKYPTLNANNIREAIKLWMQFHSLSVNK